jgi:hypothetical protein
VPAERVLTQRDLNRAVLARQRLLEPSTATIPRTLAAIGGLQAQYAPSMYVGLWSRMRGFERDGLTRALERQHATITRKQLDELVGKQHAIGVGLWIDLVRAPPAGTWERRRADVFAAAEDWLGPPPAQLTPEDAAAQLVKRYLAGFGPASRADIASYTQIAKRALAAVYERLALRAFRSEHGDELLDVARAPLPDPATPAPVRFLPTWDATLLVHARRARILPEQHRARIFGVRNPHSLPTFLVDGAVAGTWRHRDGEIELEPFERLDASTMRELRAEAERLAAFHA